MWRSVLGGGSGGEDVLHWVRESRSASSREQACFPGFKC